ncbi:acetyltransferase [Xanthobacter sediminis]|uniref:acetyltransferase n=1 Tax=Xanthobacter sediminis TaxID=3119926 RepID=UPI003728F663
MADIVLFGAGQIADVARVYIDACGPDRIVGFTVDAAHRKADSFAGRPLVDWETLERHFPPGRVKLLGPLSFRRLNAFRRSRYEEGRARGYAFATFVHPSCSNHAERIGENCFILENNTLQPFVTIGDNVIMWSNNHIGHHSQIGDHCFLSSQIGLSSNVVIGPGCFLSGQVGIEYGVTVGADSYLGTCTFIAKNMPPESVVRIEGSPVAPYSSLRLRRLL